MATKIFDYGMNGEGVAKIDGKVVLIPNSLVNEEVDIEIIKDYGNYASANLSQIITSSPNRTEPKCPYYSLCGGCQLQHMSYSEQLRFKTNHIQKTLKKITGLNLDVNDTIPCSTQYEYRNKMSFSVKDNQFGLFEEKSNNIIDMNFCPLANKEINNISKFFNDYLKNNPIESIKNIVIRSIENQTLIGVVTKNYIDLKFLFDLLNQAFKNFGLYEIVNQRKDSVVLSGKVYHVGGLKEIKINNFNVSYSVDLLGFHQTNLEIQNKLYEKVLTYIDSNSIVLNGFSGQGLLTAILSTKANHATGIEINKSSHKSAENLKQKNKIKNITNICGDFFKEIKNIKNQFDTIILDPSKKGCGKDVMQEINGIENIIYISCNPIALSKDLNVIKDNYIIEEITPFDMFPNTTSVETLVKLKLKK